MHFLYNFQEIKNKLKNNKKNKQTNKQTKKRDWFEEESYRITWRGQHTSSS